jgi:iron(III) transport system permease protein
VIAVRRSSVSPLQLAALASAVLVLSPLGYVTALALSADPAIWHRLWTTRIPELLMNTVSLAGAVALLTLVLGISTAWMVTRFEFPGRRLWEVGLVLPLAMPTYVLAYVYNYLLGFGGPVEHLWRMIAGPQARIISPQSFWGVTFVMALDTFPFVYLLTRSALLSFNVSFEEVARTCGASPLRRAFSVTLPLLRPSIVAGLALVILYVVSDFGAVSLLRYHTLTYAVFQQMTGRSDNQAASILSVLLVMLALLFLLTERWSRRKSRSRSSTATNAVRMVAHCSSDGMLDNRDRLVLRNSCLSPGDMEPVPGSSSNPRRPLLRLRPEQRPSIDPGRHCRSVGRTASRLPRQQKTDLDQYRLFASRLCRLCLAGTGRGPRGVGFLS